MQQRRDRSQLVGLNERGAAAWNTAQVSVSVTTLCPAVDCPGRKKKIHKTILSHSFVYIILYKQPLEQSCFNKNQKIYYYIIMYVCSDNMVDLQRMKSTECPRAQLLLKHRHSEMWFVLKLVTLETLSLGLIINQKLSVLRNHPFSTMWGSINEELRLIADLTSSSRSQTKTLPLRVYRCHFGPVVGICIIAVC